MNYVFECSLPAYGAQINIRIKRGFIEGNLFKVKLPRKIFF